MPIQPQIRQCKTMPECPWMVKIEISAFMAVAQPYRHGLACMPNLREVAILIFPRQFLLRR